MKSASIGDVVKHRLEEVQSEAPQNPVLASFQYDLKVQVASLAPDDSGQHRRMDARRAIW